MSKSIRIDDSIYNDAKIAAQAEFRSIPQQISFWAKVGKCALENPDLPIEFIVDTLVAKGQGREIAEEFNFE